MAELFAYTDGACSGNPGPGGWGVLMIAREGGAVIKERTLQGGEPLTTNNRMELMAVIAGLEALKKHDLNITIYSDSKYVVESVEKGWVFQWNMKPDFAKKKNREFLQSLYTRQHHVR